MRTEMSLPALTRRRFTQLSALAIGSLALPSAARAATAPNVSLEIAPYTLEASPKHRIKTVAYNGQIPGPLFRMREGQPQSVEIRNLTTDPEVVHWHGLFPPIGDRWSNGRRNTDDRTRCLHALYHDAQVRLRP
jgi:FtsP/CotA-like multicopper oxidase with cupredoxin domain